MAVLLWNDNLDIRETLEALGIPLKHEGKIELVWIPKSLIINKTNWKKSKIVEIPDWFYDKKIEELFFK